YNYQFDEMGRPSSMGGIATATWGTAGELLSFNGDSRSYNVLGQLTSITAPGMMDVEYVYVAGRNKGGVWEAKNRRTGEEVTYTYDAVNRLIQAATTDASWGQGYTYDGWGNLTGKTQMANKGAVPTYSATIDPATNGGPNPMSMPMGYTD